MDNEEIGLECFTARLWDQQERMGLDLEELSYSEHHHIPKSWCQFLILSRRVYLRGRN